eukprot:1196086-Prorocentrum_minimum.AAC.2
MIESGGYVRFSFLVEGGTLSRNGSVRATAPMMCVLNMSVFVRTPFAIAVVRRILRMNGSNR